jgi:hypothetical protein
MEKLLNYHHFPGCQQKSHPGPAREKEKADLPEDGGDKVRYLTMGKQERNSLIYFDACRSGQLIIYSLTR